jgi:hypothetical protein
MCLLVCGAVQFCRHCVFILLLRALCRALPLHVHALPLHVRAYERGEVTRRPFAIFDGMHMRRSICTCVGLYAHA